MQTKSFYFIEENKIAIAELTEFDVSFINDLIFDRNKKWYYFNRLNVPLKMRNKGIAKKLLQELIDWADKNEICIYLDINPYGDLNLEQLIKLYSKFGFVQIEEQTMVRENDYTK